MRIHVLKTWSPYFEDLESGAKRIEVRWNDRGYQVGDFLVLRHFEPKKSRGKPVLGGAGGRWLDRYVVVRVVYLFDLSDVPRVFLRRPSFVIMQLRDVSDQEFVEVMGRVTTDNEGGIWSGVGALGVR